MNSKRWLLLSDGARPTEDIYFLESVAPFLRSEGHDVGRLDVRGWRWRLARWVLSRQPGANLVLCRTLPDRVLYWLERRREMFGRIVYLIDDDLSAAAEDEALPATYRRRMARIAAMQPRLLTQADVVVASSEGLASRFEGRHGDVRVLTPPLISPLPDLSHFDAPHWWVGFHGTRAHLEDVRHIASALRRFHEASPQVSLEVMLGRHTPDELQELERLEMPDAMSWKAFQGYRQRRRMHIGLVPLLDSTFNRGKSWIKFLDIAAMGGVGIYSRRYPYTAIVEDGVNGLLADDDPDDWLRCLRLLLERPEDTARMAAAAAETAREIGNPERAVAFWQSLA